MILDDWTSKKYLHVVVVFILLLSFGCAKTAQKEIREDQFYFDRGMKNMQKKNYVNAIQDFQTMVESHPNSAVIDKAQFMLAEAHYKNEDYVTAAYEYERVYMDYPSSEYAAEAWYKKAMCWYMESPKANLDQENTRLAIDEFQRFVDNYPFDPHADDARKQIKELQEKLAYKDYRNAELYQKMKAYDAALIYYELVISEHSQSAWVDFSRYGMGLVHMKLMDRELNKLKKIDANDQLMTDKIKENARKEYDQAKMLFTMVVNSNAISYLKKEASGKLSELEEVKELK